MTISGETIDYGPCAFMDHFNFNQVYSYIDSHGRYAYLNQPKILMWNLSRLADCLIPLVGDREEEAIARLNHELSLLPKTFELEFNQRMAQKFGLADDAGMEEILKSWFEYLQTEKLDFTLSFRKLSQLLDGRAIEFFPITDLFRKFEALWRPRLGDVNRLQQQMDATNPLFIPRNHQVDKAIKQANLGDFSSFHELNDILSTPFTERPELLHYSVPPRPDEVIKNTFCGT
jgi:serine/tyrosine/threonine adenylyltransferase